MILERSKTNYYFKLADKLLSKKLNQKYHWSILKILLNGKKIPCAPPIFHNGNFVSNIRQKSELFNTSFAQQCSLIKNRSTLPSCIFPKADKSLSTIYFSEEDILNIIRSLDPYKAHGHDNISNRMIKLCRKKICKPLHLIFVSCMEERIFTLLWKMANVVLAHKK